MAQQMVFPDATWQSVVPESVLIDSSRLEAAINTVPSTGGLMITRSGRVIWHGDQIESPQHVWSVTKSVASTAMGLLVDDGIVKPDTRVAEYVPAMEELYPDATLRHFVTQTSGYIAIDERVPLSPPFPLPDHPFTPGSPLFTPPGSQSAYTSASMDMFTNALTRAAGEPLQALFTRRIADPIGMDPASWDWGDFVTDDGLVVDGGAGFPGKGVSISATDAARLGLLFLNRGQWNGEQLISSDWVDMATQVQVPASVPLHPQSATTGPGTYGFGWWVMNNGWYHAIGNENNYISVNPGLEMVVASLGTELGGIPYDTYMSFVSRLNNSLVPVYWDEQGDGVWSDRDPGTGDSRWVAESGVEPIVYPTAMATIRSNTVTIDKDLSLGSIDVEQGGIHIARSASVQSTGSIELEDNSTLLVEGALEASTLRLGANSSMILDGAVEVEQLRVNDSTLALHDVQQPFAIGRIFSIQGESLLSIDVTDPSWDSTVIMSRGRPLFSGELLLEFTANMNWSDLEGKVLNLFDWDPRLEPNSEFDQITIPSRIDADLNEFYSTGDIIVRSVLDAPTLAGDFTGDDILDASDIDELAARIRFETQDTFFDVNQDETIDQSDKAAWVELIGKTYLGDANLDQMVGFEDFTLLTANFGRPGGWAGGDFDGSGDVAFPDFLILSESYGQAPSTTATVPEPSSGLMTLWLALTITQIRRRLFSATHSRFDDATSM